MVREQLKWVKNSQITISVIAKGVPYVLMCCGRKAHFKQFCSVDGFFGFCKKFNLMKNAFKIEISVWIFYGYCLDTCPCACKRISLDGQYFISILTLEVWKNCVQKQGKKYQNSYILSNNFIFLSFYMQFWVNFNLKSCITILCYVEYFLFQCNSVKILSCIETLCLLSSWLHCKTMESMSKTAVGFLKNNHAFHE